MKVYLVYIGTSNDDISTPLGIYSSMEKAEAHIKSLRMIESNGKVKNVKTGELTDFYAGDLHSCKKLFDYDFDKDSVCAPEQIRHTHNFEWISETCFAVASVMEKTLDDDLEIFET